MKKTQYPSAPDSGEWAACPGQDNPSTQCIVGDVPEIWDGDESDHDGPYNGVETGMLNWHDFA
ncbi:uncharacterized protein BJ212DRAFT_1489209 [Suillus subaureus]|uniref:Uncharacterized protein n=1 Tax=Suillus subaureus TaxID=48587 RepID=A0A9P7DK73_9AGAM|nr:uncharacterized protein BJ212DRAFT_1489209 [Suillus subaureus]KAG1796842.1 hypothetical protein BJ212DRAFT_1489209 [Suillus subaureus]